MPYPQSRSEAPTTEVPTTEAPTTEVPTTEAPTTEVRATEVPATEVPAPEVPTGLVQLGEPVPHTKRRRRLPTFGLSMTQLVATGLAATTATIAASFLGVTGTVIGAAIASVTSAVGNAVYGTSLRRGRDRVRVAVPVLAGRPSPHVPAAGDGRPAGEVTPAGLVPAASEAAPDLPSAPLVRPVVWKRIAIGSISVFVAVLAVVTGVEVVAGRPIADVVRGDSGSGTSFFGDTQVQTTTRTVTPSVPTMTVTVTPKVVVTTPTITQTAPATTRTATGSASSTHSSSTSSGGSSSPASSTSPS